MRQGIPIGEKDRSKEGMKLDMFRERRVVLLSRAVWKGEAEHRSRSEVTGPGYEGP